MPVNIYIYCPAAVTGLPRSDLQEKLDDFFGDAAQDVGAGSGNEGFNLDYELAKGENSEQWVNRLRDLLRQAGVPPGAAFDVFPDGWEPGAEYRRVEVFGDDYRLTSRPE